MANVIITSGGLVPTPEPAPPPEGGLPMAEELVFPRFYFSAAEPNGRQFDTREAFDAAGGQAVWKFTPQEAQEASTTPTPTPEPHQSDEGHSAPRSRR